LRLSPKWSAHFPRKRSVEIKPKMVGWFIQTAIEFNPEIRRTEELENVR
jgi:hypothetical protein